MKEIGRLKNDCLRRRLPKPSVYSYATIPKGIVGGFEFTVIKRNLKVNGTRGHGIMFASAKGKQKK